MTEKITTAEELDALPVGSVVVNPFDNTEYHKTRTGKWVQSSGDLWLAEEIVRDDQEVVLYHPDAPAPSTEDREALARVLVPDAFPAPADGEDENIGRTFARRSAYRAADAALAWFATRQPAPTVSAEQVNAGARACRPTVFENRFATSEQEKTREGLRVALAAMGFEVTP